MTTQEQIHPPPGRVAAYIDGFNLYFGLRQKGWRRYYWLDIKALCERLLKPGQSLVATRYFTTRVAPVPQDPDQGRRQTVYLDALAAHSGIRPAYGHYLPKSITCRSCGAQWRTYEEKCTDVNIAIEMLADAHADLFDTALLVSADSDLAAPIQKIRQLFPAKRVIVAFPPARHSVKLQGLAHGSFQIGEANLRQCQLPDPVLTQAGFPLRRPPSWN